MIVFSTWYANQITLSGVCFGLSDFILNQVVIVGFIVTSLIYAIFFFSEVIMVSWSFSSTPQALVSWSNLKNFFGKQVHFSGAELRNQYNRAKGWGVDAPSKSVGLWYSWVSFGASAHSQMDNFKPRKDTQARLHQSTQKYKSEVNCLPRKAISLMPGNATLMMRQRVLMKRDYTTRISDRLADCTKVIHKI